MEKRGSNLWLRPAKPELRPRDAVPNACLYDSNTLTRRADDLGQLQSGQIHRLLSLATLLTFKGAAMESVSQVASCKCRNGVSDNLLVLHCLRQGRYRNQIFQALSGKPTLQESCHIV